jgi:LuxR family transcriptional regulator, activator of tox operons
MQACRSHALAAMQLRFLGAESDGNAIARDMSPVIGAIGTSKFEDSLLSMARNAARCTHLTAFSSSLSSEASRAPKALIALNCGKAPVARQLASTYIRHYWNLDPANSLLKSELRVGRRAMLRLQSHEIENLAYRRECYRSVDLIDRFSLIKTLGNEVVRINFYRKASSGRFSEADLVALSTLADLAITAIGKHDALNSLRATEAPYDRYCRRLALSAPRLSSREIQVCAQIVMGLRSDAIAHELGLSINTILSHRRRAYAKLEISSQTELFHMLLD